MHDDPGDPDGPDEQATFGEDLRKLIDDGRALAAAELAWHKARAAYAGRAAAGIALTGAIAAAFALFALVALTIGLLLALTPLLGAWLAMAVVAGGLLLLALIFFAVTMTRINRVSKQLSDESEQA